MAPMARSMGIGAACAALAAAAVAPASAAVPVPVAALPKLPAASLAGLATRHLSFISTPSPGVGMNVSCEEGLGLLSRLDCFEGVVEDEDDSEVCHADKLSDDCMDQLAALGVLSADEVEANLGGIRSCTGIYATYAAYASEEPAAELGGMSGAEYLRLSVRHQFGLCGLDGDLEGWQSTDPCMQVQDSIIGVFGCFDAAIEEVGCFRDDCEEVCHPDRIPRRCVDLLDALDDMTVEEVDDKLNTLAGCPTDYSMYGSQEPSDAFGGYSGAEYTKYILRHRNRLCGLDGDLEGWQSSDPCVQVQESIVGIFECFDAAIEEEECDEDDCEEVCHPDRIPRRCVDLLDALDDMTVEEVDDKLNTLAGCPTDYSMYGSQEPVDAFGGYSGADYTKGVLRHRNRLCALGKALEGWKTDNVCLAAREALLPTFTCLEDVNCDGDDEKCGPDECRAEEIPPMCRVSIAQLTPERVEEHLAGIATCTDGHEAYGNTVADGTCGPVPCADYVRFQFNRNWDICGLGEWGEDEPTFPEYVGDKKDATKKSKAKKKSKKKKKLSKKKKKLSKKDIKKLCKKASKSKSKCKKEKKHCTYKKKKCSPK